MGHTACREPQCLYKGELYLYLLFMLVHKHSALKGSKHLHNEIIIQTVMKYQHIYWND